MFAIQTPVFKKMLSKAHCEKDFNIKHNFFYYTDKRSRDQSERIRIRYMGVSKMQMPSMDHKVPMTCKLHVKNPDDIYDLPKGTTS